MNRNYKRQLKEKSKPVSFKKTHELFSAVTLGVGSLMGAGLYVLVGIASAEAGPSLWAAYGICGLLTFLSVVMYADLSRKLPISGGGYVYAYNQLGSFWGFMVGWHLAVGSIFACALYAKGFAAYSAQFLPMSDVRPWMLIAISIFLVVLLCTIGLRGGKGGDRVQRIFTWGNLAVLVVLAAVAVPFADVDNFSPTLPKGFSGIGAAISLIYISFFGYQLIANSAEEVHNAKKTVPLAMKISWFIALLFYVLISLVSSASVNWTALAASDAPLVLVATRGLGKWGVILIGIGGILASVAALNGTLLSQARQIFAMGRDRLLPDLLGKLNRKGSVPSVALAIGGLATVLVLIFADLTFIAKAANFSLLFSMLPISMALHSLYQKEPSDTPRVSWYRRAVPFLALAANGILLLTLDYPSLFFGGSIVAAGCLVFFSYSNSAEKRGQAGFSIALGDDDRRFDILRRGERILVPVANPETQESLFSISQALLPASGGEIIVLNVVVADEPRAALQDSTGANRAVDVMGRMHKVADERDVKFRPVVRAAKSLSEGIVHASVEERADLIVMGWSVKRNTNPSNIIRNVILQTRMDAVFLQLTEDRNPKRIGVALGGTGNMSLMIRVAGTLAEQYGGDVTYLNVIPEYFEQKHLRRSRKIQLEAIRRHESPVPCQTELLRSANPLEALVEKTKELDLLVVGAAYFRSFDTNVVGSFSSMIADKAHCTVAIVRQAPPLSVKMK